MFMPVYIADADTSCPVYGHISNFLKNVLVIQELMYLIQLLGED